MKIVSVVPNSAVRDARIMKQARSLKEAGHDVSIIGIQEPKFSSFRSITKEGIYVYRVPVIERQQDMVNRGRMLSAFSMLFVAGVIALATLLLINSYIFNFFDSSLEDYSVWDISRVIALIGFNGIILLAMLYFLIKRNPVPESVKVRINDMRANRNIRNTFKARRQSMKIEVSELLLELKPDLIYCHECLSLEGCHKAKEALGVPLVYDAHEFYDEIEGTNAHILREMYTDIHGSVLHKSDAMVVTGDAGLNLYKEAGYTLPNTQIILPNSIPAPDLPDYDGRLHEAANLPKDQKILIYQGGLSVLRRIDQVIKSAEELPDDWSIVTLGGGADFDLMTKIAEEINQRSYYSSLTKLAHSGHDEKYEEFFRSNLSRIRKGASPVSLDGESAALPQSSETGLSEFLESELGNLFQFMSKSTGARISADRDRIIQETYENRKSQILKLGTKLAEAKTDVYKQEIALAQRLALMDLAATTNFQAPNRVSILQPVPNEELLLWTQGASLGIIPYPISGKNHWGAAPNKLWEYPAAGVPVLATPSIEMFNIIQRHQMGWMLSADPVASEIANIVSGLTEEDLNSAREGCRDFIENSNWTIHTRDWMTQIESL